MSKKEDLAKELTRDYGKGFLISNLNEHSHLGWTHYRILSGIKEKSKRGFYFDQT